MPALLTLDVSLTYETIYHTDWVECMSESINCKAVTATNKDINHRLIPGRSYRDKKIP